MHRARARRITIMPRLGRHLCTTAETDLQVDWTSLASRIVCIIMDAFVPHEIPYDRIRSKFIST